MEVEEGFVRYLLPFYTPRPKSGLGFVVEDFISDAEEGRPEDFMQRMQAFFADGDYQVPAIWKTISKTVCG